MRDLVVPENPWSLQSDAILEQLAVDPELGLDAQQVRERAAVFGPNELEPPQSVSKLKILARARCPWPF